jgi:hypothetical protein
MLTWYDLLGIAPGATAAQVQDAAPRLVTG